MNSIHLTPQSKRRYSLAPAKAPRPLSRSAGKSSPSLQPTSPTAGPKLRTMVPGVQIGTPARQPARPYTGGRVTEPVLLPGLPSLSALCLSPGTSQTVLTGLVVFPLKHPMLRKNRHDSLKQADDPGLSPYPALLTPFSSRFREANRFPPAKNLRASLNLLENYIRGGGALLRV